MIKEIQMKNTLKLSGIGLMLLLATVSCQKNEKADPMPEPVEETTPEQPMTKASFKTSRNGLLEPTCNQTSPPDTGKLNLIT